MHRLSRNDYLLVVNAGTKDKDFANLSIARGAPPKVILPQTGNYSTVQIIGMVRINAVRFSDFEIDAQRSLLVLR